MNWLFRICITLRQWSGNNILLIYNVRAFWKNKQIYILMAWLSNRKCWLFLVTKSSRVDGTVRAGSQPASTGTIMGRVPRNLGDVHLLLKSWNLEMSLSSPPILIRWSIFHLVNNPNLSNSRRIVDDNLSLNLIVHFTKILILIKI